MNIKTFIEMGEKKAGKQIELAKMLGVTDSYLRTVKTGRNGLNDAVCIELAKYIEVDPLEVIAASNLVTEKDERRRKVFESCLKNSRSAAAGVTIALLVTTVLTLAPIKPASASYLSFIGDNLHIIRNSIDVKESGEKLIT
ncbi:helix-turn-helix transcriptional regulator [Nitrosomonas sp. Nm34]|uniref:helix-turn-helix domain-containing protein n=1 Tax=Nitrosomonas sp. Nm34 TaxID=1881055 RepID=UPI0008E3DA51|nr:helix-turn-helix transcriptional regulator [Nitrosomonas sp. Nm34]SFI45401.1 hypothetical protein SAMN05428978_10114 [Nitrosomonas sp. Nm34]